ncbi:MAG: hypothetical protein LQ339_004545 [Xanthoria mediterranea]|nr:MAG: hypothetical protein LQ339_004545 [Xanthoria mediterranea]
MKLSLWMIAASFAASSMALPSRLEIDIDTIEDPHIQCRASGTYCGQTSECCYGYCDEFSKKCKNPSTIQGTTDSTFFVRQKGEGHR